MIIESNDKASLKVCCTDNVQNTEICVLVHLLLKNQKETSDNLHSLQKSIAGLREQDQDFRAEQAEDNAEVKRQLSELRRNKVWLSSERV
jgi:hypothetical protein